VGGRKENKQRKQRNERKKEPNLGKEKWEWQIKLI
jgi:hypothetical protein